MQKLTINAETGESVLMEFSSEDLESLPEVQPLPVPTSISFSQLLIGLVTEGWITEAEGRAWRDRVGLPAAVQSVIAAMPEGQRFAAETRALAPSQVERENALVIAIATAANKQGELDEFFRTYSMI